MIISTIPVNAYNVSIFQLVAPEKILDLFASGDFISQGQILHCFLLCDTVLCPNPALLSLAVCYAVAWPPQHNVEVHPIDTNTGIVLDA